MSEQIDERWGPKDMLGRSIAQVPYPEPDASLTKRIMSQLKPKPRRRLAHLLERLRVPVTFTMSPALAVLMLMFVCLPAGLLVHQWKTDGAVPPAVRQDNGGIPVTFHFDNANATSVSVMGTFNNWDPKGYELERRQDSGSWSIVVNLPPGRHDYAFLVDGEKISPDPHADLTQRDDYGNRNSVKFVQGGNGRRI